MGPHKIYPSVLRELADVIARTLSFIFEKSWWSDEVPSDWKKGKIFLILKEGENTQGSTDW